MPESEVGIEVNVRDLVERLALLLMQPRSEQQQIAPVRIERVLRESVFQPERIAEFLDDRLPRTLARFACDRHQKPGTFSCCSSQRLTF